MSTQNMSWLSITDIKYSIVKETKDYGLYISIINIPNKHKSIPLGINEFQSLLDIFKSDVEDYIIVEENTSIVENKDSYAKFELRENRKGQKLIIGQYVYIDSVNIFISFINNEKYLMDTLDIMTYLSFGSYK